MRYARDTAVSVERSKAEIEKILSRYGAQQFMTGWDQDRALIAFVMSERRIRFFLPMPDKKQFETTPSGRVRHDQDDIDKAWEQAQRQSWRALLLVIKAKLEAVESKITTIDDEFMAHIVMPGGKTLGEIARPQIADAYANKRALLQLDMKP